jgi:hypothetical protein
VQLVLKLKPSITAVNINCKPLSEKILNNFIFMVFSEGKEIANTAKAISKMPTKPNTIA